MTIKHVQNIHELAWELGCSAKQLGYYLYKRSIRTQYKIFEIPKRRGGFRKISAPSTNLKLIQKSLYREFAKDRMFKPCVNGFVTGCGIITNALPHVGHRYLLNIDLDNFFDSINYGRVYGLLTKTPFQFPRPVAAAIAKACILENKLPQGAPTSPIISNLICSKMDSELSKLAKSHGCVYTRYADDLTFSSRTRPLALASRERQPDGTYIYSVSPTLVAIIEANGFRINASKVRVSHREHRQEVTGLIVNKRLNVKRRLVREVRAMLHAWRKFGLKAAQDHFSKKYSGMNKDFELALRGKISFVGQVRGRPDSVFKGLASQFNKLTSGPEIRIQLTSSEIATQATWAFESSEGQGTAFFLSDVGLVTCSHCIGDSNKIYHPSNFMKEFQVKVVARDERRDLAVLEVPDELKSIEPLSASKTEPKNKSKVKLYGYPAHHAARPIRIEDGEVIRRFPKSLVRYLEITPKIIGGNSGGPLLNEKYEVIGVAVLGLNGKIEMKSAEFLAVSINELQNITPSTA